MLSRRLSVRLPGNAFLAAALAIGLVAPLSAAPKGQGKQAPIDSGRARPEFTLARTAEQRQSLFEAWKKQHRPAPGTASTATKAAAGTVQSDVGRAAMIINAAGTVIYTKNFLGNNCDPNIEANNVWNPNFAYAAGAIIQSTTRTGFNFKATNAGTTGATPPTWPTSGIGATVVDGTITWSAVAFDPADFAGCQPMQLVSRASGGTETVIAQESTTLADGSQVAGWSEFVAANESGEAAFRAALAGYFMNDGDDEGGSGIITAGPGAGTVTRIAGTSTTIGGRAVCGFSAMVGINGAGQVVFDTYPVRPGNAPRCDENNHGIVRFTPGGTGNELLVQQGDTVGTPSSTIIGFGADDNSGSGFNCPLCEYQNIEGRINSAGHVAVVLRLADGTQGVYDFSGPGVSTQVARTGATLTALGPRVSWNDGDQVVYRGTSSGVDHLFRFTPPSTTTTIISVGDSFNGSTVASIGAFSDINASGNVVFMVKTAAGNDVYGYWDGTPHVVASAAGGTLSSEMITVNDANQVAYVTGIILFEETDGASEQHENGGAFSWTLAGGSTKLIQVGDVVNGAPVTSIYAQHPSFARRQWSQAGCLATAYSTSGDDPDFDCTEGGTACNPPLVRGGQLFVSCATGVCPVITIAPPTLPAGTQGTPYNQQLVASGGQAPYTYTVSIGTTPPGTNLSAAGLLNGTPTTTGTFNFTVTATDANNCTGTIAYSLVIGAPTQVTIALAPPSRIVVVGNSTNFTASINIPQSTDTVVTLTSSNPSIATVPATVTILANQTSAIFTATGVAIGGPVTITATLPSSFGATPATASVTVVAAPAATVPTLSTWALILLAAALAGAGFLLSKRI